MMRDINDGLKSIAIIGLFIVIIGLIIISTHPEKFAEMIFFWRSRSNNVREGNANIDSECHQCVISPTIGPASGITNIDANIIQRERDDPSSVLPRKGGAENLYISSSDMSYVFCSWSSDTNKSMRSSEWLDKCEQYMYSSDIACCHGSTGDFYDGNYIIDTLHNEKYMGLVFKYDISSSALVKSGIGEQMIARNLYNFSPVAVDKSAKQVSFNNGRFKYFTTITSDSMASSLKIGERVEDNSNSVTVDKLINCEGVLVSPPAVTTPPDWKDMPLDLNALSGQNANTNTNTNTNTTGTVIATGTSNDTLNPSNFDDTTSNISREVQSQLKSAVDSLVKQFETKINSMNIASNIDNTNNRLQYPNIGNPTYLNIGSCNNNSPYVYNSGCNTGSESGSGYLNQYQCYPSMTGEFQDCGPQGYNSLPQF